MTSFTMMGAVVQSPGLLKSDSQRPKYATCPQKDITATNNLRNSAQISPTELVHRTQHCAASNGEMFGSNAFKVQATRVSSVNYGIADVLHQYDINETQVRFVREINPLGMAFLRAELDRVERRLQSIDDRHPTVDQRFRRGDTIFWGIGNSALCERTDTNRAIKNLRPYRARSRR